MIHLDQGFEADFQISRMVPGLVKQGNRQVPGWEPHSFSHLYRHFTGSSHLGEVLPGVFESSCCKRSRKIFLRFRNNPSHFPRC